MAADRASAQESLCGGQIEASRPRLPRADPWNPVQQLDEELSAVGFYLSGLLTLMFFDSGTTIDLTAPKDGSLAGILFFEDRKALPLRVHRIGSNNARNLVGTI